MGREYTLRMPTIRNAIRQMDQSAPGQHQAKSSWSRDQWISVNPTERGRRLGCMSPHASLSLPFERVSLSLSHRISPHPPPPHPSVCHSLCYVVLLTFTTKFHQRTEKRKKKILPSSFHLSILSSSVQADQKPRAKHSH